MSNAAIEIINLEIQDLKKRLAVLQQALETLRASDGKKIATQGRGPNSAFTVHSETLDVLREASAPMTVQEIADAIIPNTHTVHMACLSMHSHLKRILSRSRSFIRANGGN